MNAHGHITLAQNELGVIDDDWRLAGKAIPNESIIAYCQAHATIALAQTAAGIEASLDHIVHAIQATEETLSRLVTAVNDLP